MEDLDNNGTAFTATVTDDYVVAVGGVDSLKGKGMVIHVATND